MYSYYKLWYDTLKAVNLYILCEKSKLILFELFLRLIKKQDRGEKNE